MSDASFAEIASALSGVKRVVVASHVRPDGDALGSIIPFALWLESLGKSVAVWNEDGVPEKFRYLPRWEKVSRPPETPEAFDAVVALDTSVKNRLGTVLDAISDAPLWINIDHHVSNERFGHLNLIDPSAPATGQIVFEFFRALNIPITPDMAGNLFAAISTDTGSFQYAGTDGRTFSAGGALIEAGVNVAELSRQMYESQPRRRLELLRHALNSAKFTCDDQVVSFSLSLDDAGRLAVLPEDNEGIIDHLRSVDGIVGAVFFEELPEGRVRVSARSKDPRVDACRICGLFGGGGHKLAAGARIKGSLEEVEQKFLEAVCNEVRNRN